MDFKYLAELRNFLLKQYERANNYKKKRLTYDFSFFNSLVLVSGFSELEIAIPAKYVYQVLPYKVYDFLYYFEYVADTVIEMYKDMDFFFDGRTGNTRLSKKDKDDILREFLIPFCPDAYKIYQDLLSKGRVFNFVEAGFSGEAYILTESNLAYVGINEKAFSDDLFSIESLIHELMHIYSQLFLKNYSWITVENTIDGFYLEAITIYSELEFYNFLVKNHICTDSVYLHANYNDRIRLEYYKKMKYIAEMEKREDADIVLNGTDYTIVGNNRLEKDKDNRIYRYHESYKEGNLNNFVYAMSLIDAYELLKMRINGDKNIINDYLISMQNQYKFEEDAERGFDLTFMRDDIKKHNDEIMKMYQRKKDILL